MLLKKCSMFLIYNTLIHYFLYLCSTIGNTPSIDTSESDIASASITRRSSSGGLLSPEVELGGKYVQQWRKIYKKKKLYKKI